MDESIGQKLREIFEQWPLYRKYEYTPQGYATRPNLIRLYCSVCRQDQPWEVEQDREATFRCRACQESVIVFYVQWGKNEEAGTRWVMKVGQYPALIEKIELQLEERLETADLDLYRKALRSRSFNFGIGALSYLRRVVENKTNDLLDLIADAAVAAGDKTVQARVAEAKYGYRFEDKVALAAEILPQALRPGGINPLHALHDLASTGIHRLAEHECIDLFDKARAGFEYVFKQLQVEKSAAAEYVEAMNKLQTAKSQTAR